MYKVVVAAKRTKTILLNEKQNYGYSSISIHIHTYSTYLQLRLPNRKNSFALFRLCYM